MRYRNFSEWTYEGGRKSGNVLSSTRRKPKPLSFGVAEGQRKVDAMASITGGTAGFPVPELGGSFFVFGGRNVDGRKTMARLGLSLIKRNAIESIMNL